jgi:hypothetical protein
MTKPLPLRLSVAAVALVLALAGVALGQGLKPQRDFSHTPTVYGGGSLFVYSGLNGLTSHGAPVTAVTLDDGLGFRFDLPKAPTLHIYPPAPGLSVIKWQMVTGDTLVGTVSWDTEPLVIIFADRNHVIGRLPPSFRITQEGGDTSAVLLKNDVEGRTLFSFCYDTSSTEVKTIKGKDKVEINYISPAGQGAAAGYRISLEGALDSNLDFYKRLPPVPQSLDKWWIRTVPKAFSVLKANLNAPEGSLKNVWPTPARQPLHDQWMADTAYDCLGLMHYDVKLAKGALENIYAFQDESGMIPGHMTLQAASDVSNPPILGWVAWQVYSYEPTPDPKFLARSFDVVQKHVTWFLKKRRIGGEPPATQDLADGTPLYFWQSAEEAGVEASPRFKGGAFAAVDLSCYLANECYALRTMAQTLGFGELAKTWGARGDSIAAAARKQLWDDQRGFFFDRTAADGEFLPTWSYAGFLPLWSGVATPDQAARVKNHLLSKKFWTELPVPVLATDDPAFKKDLWSGPVWMHVNYLIIRGLERYGFSREATEVRDKTLGTIAEDYRKTGTLWEYYDPSAEKLPSEMTRSGGSGAATRPIGDYNKTAALYIDMILRPKP